MSKAGDYRVTVRVRNARLARAIENAGYDSVPAFARAAGVSYHTVNDLLNMKSAPIGRGDAFRPAVEKIAQYLKMLPEDLFPPEFLTRALERNTLTADVDAPGLAAILHQAPRTPELLLEQGEALTALAASLDNLPPREKLALSLKYGLVDGREWTFAEIGRHPGISRNPRGVTAARTMVLVNRAYTRLKHPARQAGLRDALDALTEE